MVYNVVEIFVAKYSRKKERKKAVKKIEVNINIFRYFGQYSRNIWSKRERDRERKLKTVKKKIEVNINI